MRILVLEDEEYRRKWFRQNLIGNVVDFTDDVSEAKELLTANSYDKIYLDHDLKPEHYGGRHDEGTGFEIAEFLAKRTDLSHNAEIIIHSLSESGSDRMFRKLKESRRDVIKRKFHLLSPDLTTVGDLVRPIPKINFNRFGEMNLGKHIGCSDVKWFKFKGL